MGAKSYFIVFTRLHKRNHPISKAQLWLAWKAKFWTGQGWGRFLYIRWLVVCQFSRKISPETFHCSNGQTYSINQPHFHKWAVGTDFEKNIIFRVGRAQFAILYYSLFEDSLNYEHWSNAVIRENGNFWVWPQKLKLPQQSEFLNSIHFIGVQLNLVFIHPVNQYCMIEVKITRKC